MGDFLHGVSAIAALSMFCRIVKNIVKTFRLPRVAEGYVKECEKKKVTP